MNSDWQIFPGSMNENVAQVYARHVGTNSSSAKITGRVRGPFNALAQTLPANSPFQMLPPGDSLLARAVVTDPCTWSPDSPALYQVQVELQGDPAASSVAYQTTTFGFRRFGTRAQSLNLNGRRWVLRGIAADNQFTSDIAAYKELAITLVIQQVDVSLLTLASQQGWPILVDASHNIQLHWSTVWEWAQFPCVLAIVLPTWHESWPPIPNLVRVQRLHPGESAAAWADVVLLDITEPHTSVDFSRYSQPIIAWQRVDCPSLLAAREAIDLLQASLAGNGPMAGYVVQAK
jgi:Glycosyl hydrolases family 2